MKLPIVPLIAIGSFLWAVHSVISSQPQRLSTEPPVMPPRSAFASTLSAVGLIEPSSESIILGSHRSGVVERVMVELGQQVKTGQALVQLDTRELRAQLAVDEARQTEAAAQLRVAEAENLEAERRYGYAEKLRDTRAMSEEEITQRQTARQTTAARIEAAQAALALARAQCEVTRTEMERCTVRAPRDASVLQLRVRAGEFISAVASATPWLILGDTQTLHLRADVDEHEAWRVRSSARAVAHVRGRPEQQSTLEFVRFEPLVIPKKSLTGDATERVDTRVLQIIYRLQKAPPAALFVGQQMDVFIAAE